LDTWMIVAFDVAGEARACLTLKSAV
jgi:hypothetical protein